MMMQYVYCSVNEDSYIDVELVKAETETEAWEILINRYSERERDIAESFELVYSHEVI